MSKKITLKQLGMKKYNLVPGLSATMAASLGEIEDSFDMIIYGASGNGKTSLTAQWLRDLITALGCRCSYISYEEGHGKTMQDSLINRYNLLHEVGNNIDLWDHLTYDELIAKMAKRRAPKIWVIDSIQAARFTAHQCLKIKEQFVRSKNGKIIIFISWADGKYPSGALGKSVEYFANIKVRVENLVAFIKSRYGGNKPYIINEEKAREKWGTKAFNKLKKQAA
jgi:predicted ATP-dependent serine protease